MNDFINSQAFNLDSAVIPIAPTGFKSGFIGIIGRPNVGKSTLMNQLVGQKIAITSPIAQTTRNRLRGIVTDERSQMIFVDTPGIHKPHHELGKVLVKNAENAINSVDLVLFVVDSSNFLGNGDRYIADLLTKNQTPTILGLNKADQQPEAPEPIDDSYRTLAAENNWPLLKFSAINVERASQKGIVIGKNGSMLKAIGSSARSAIQKLIAGEVYLKLFVKVEPKWRQSRSLLAEFGYRTEE